MFLDEALKKEPKSLQETFHTWYDFMEDRITFGQFVSLLHTKNHCARVLLYCLKIANLAKLSEEERIKTVKRVAFGMRDFNRFRNRILYVNWQKRNSANALPSS